MANLQNPIENHNFLAFQKELSIMNVTFCDDRLVYHLSNNKIALQVEERANKIIARLNLPLEAKASRFPFNTMVVKELEGETIWAAR